MSPVSLWTGSPTERRHSMGQLGLSIDTEGNQYVIKCVRVPHLTVDEKDH